jgi:hypothetical protein
MSEVADRMAHVKKITGGNPDAVDGNQAAWTPQIVGGSNPEIRLPDLPEKPKECKCDELVSNPYQLPELSGNSGQLDDRSHFASGAVRSSDTKHQRYDLISPVGLRRLAEAYAEGAKKYSDRNWEKGFPMSDTMNHLLTHLVKYMAGDNSEDHLGHAAFNVFALMHFEERNPECQDIPARSACGAYPKWWEKG